jgi:NAD+ synthase
MADQTLSPVDLRLPESEIEDRRQHIQSFIASVVEDAGAEGAVIGLSGGIDSTLTAHLAVEALGTDALHALVMPGVVSRESNMSDAERVARHLGVSHDVVPIDPLVEAFLDAYPEAAGDETAVGNARARVRAVLGYLVANHESRVVLGTGNRTEALVGYFTKYGDQAVDCNPIGNLYKQQVRQLARHVGVPEDIVTKPPTAELWADQTDEAELGIDYDTLDAILAVHVDGGVPAEGAARLLDVDPDVVERVHTMYEHSAHKRAMPPVPGVE